MMATAARQSPRKRLAIHAAQSNPACERLLHAAEAFGWPAHPQPLLVEVPFGPSEPFRTVIEFADFLRGLVPQLFGQLRARWLSPELTLSKSLSQATEWPPMMDLLPADAPQAQRIIDDLNVQTLAHPVLDARNQRIWGYWLSVRGWMDGRLRSADELFCWAAQNNLTYALDQHCLRHHLQRVRATTRRRQPLNYVMHLQFESLRKVDVSLADLKAELNCGIDARHLIFHMTDGARRLPVEVLRQQILEIRQLGIGTAVTDASRGFSDLEWMTALEPDLLRLSSRTIEQIDRSPLQAASAQAIVDLGRTLKVPVVAQCVDSATALKRAQGLKVPLMQGNGIRQLQSFVM